MANQSTLALPGISNQNGNLTQGTGTSSFQLSCGDIRLDVDRNNVDLVALCRTIAGTFKRTSLPLNISATKTEFSAPRSRTSGAPSGSARRAGVPVRGFGRNPPRRKTTHVP